MNIYNYKLNDKFSFFKNQETGEIRVVFSYMKDTFTVVKFMKGAHTVKIWFGDYEDTVSQWKTKPYQVTGLERERLIIDSIEAFKLATMTLSLTNNFIALSTQEN